MEASGRLGTSASSMARTSKAGEFSKHLRLILAHRLGEMTWGGDTCPSGPDRVGASSRSERVTLSSWLTQSPERLARSAPAVSPLTPNEPSLLGEDAGFKVVGADPELVSPAKHGVEVAGVGGDGPSGLVEREARVFA